VLAVRLVKWKDLVIVMLGMGMGMEVEMAIGPGER